MSLNFKVTQIKNFRRILIPIELILCNIFTNDIKINEKN